MARSDGGISAILAKQSFPASALLNAALRSRTRSRIAAFSSEVKTDFFATLLTAIADTSGQTLVGFRKPVHDSRGPKRGGRGLGMERQAVMTHESGRRATSRSF